MDSSTLDLKGLAAAVQEIVRRDVAAAVEEEIAAAQERIKRRAEEIAARAAIEVSRVVDPKRFSSELVIRVVGPR